MTSDRSSLAARLLGPPLLLGAAVLLSLAVAEVVLRQRIPLDTGAYVKHRIPDPQLGWRLEGGVHYTNANPEFATEVTHNRAGYRDVEHAVAAPDDVFRIVVIGDSFMEGFSVELEEQFSRRLEALLRADGRKVEVINLGVGGYGTLQEYLAYVHDGRRYAPDLVLLATFVSNDVRNNSQQLESRLWQARGASDHIKIKNRPFLEPGPDGAWDVTVVDYEGSLASYQRARKRAETSWTAWLYARSALFRVTRVAVAKARGASRKEAGGQADGAAWLGVYACEPLPAYDEAWELTGRILHRLARDVRSDGGALAVFTVPAFHEVDAEHRARILARVSDPERYCIEDARGNARLADLLAGLEVPLVDLLPAFRREARAGENPLFRSTDEHWNAAGHDLAARRVAATLVEQGLVP